MDLRAMFLGLGFVLMWSSAFTPARFIVADAPPLAALSLRFLVSGLIGVGIARAIGQSWILTARQWRAVAVFGFCQNALYLGLNFVAMQRVEAGLAPTLPSLMPILVAALRRALRGRRMRPPGRLRLGGGQAGRRGAQGRRGGGGGRAGHPGASLLGAGGGRPNRASAGGFWPSAPHRPHMGPRRVDFRLASTASTSAAAAAAAWSTSPAEGSGSGRNLAT